MTSQREFSGKVVIITGAASGIGKATALRFATLGASLSLADLNEAGLEPVAKEVLALSGVKPLSLRCDVSKDDDNVNLISKTAETFGKIDVLVNNAGLGKISTIDFPTLMADFDFVMKINVRAPLHLSSLAVPHLRKSKGNIVNVSSVASMKVPEFMLGYGVSKAAVTKLTQSLSAELAKDGVRVNEVNPGFASTGIWAAFGFTSDQEKDIVSGAKKLAPLGKLIEVEQIARVITALASDEQSGNTTGLSYIIDGGINHSLVRT